MSQSITCKYGYELFGYEGLDANPLNSNPEKG
jgi:hypothetical protein